MVLASLDRAGPLGDVVVSIQAGSRHALSTPNIDVLIAHNAGRLIVLHRWRGPEHYRHRGAQRQGRNARKDPALVAW